MRTDLLRTEEIFFAGMVIFVTMEGSSGIL